jgi:hypothetical protein
MPAAKSLGLIEEGQLKAGETVTGPFGIRPEHTLEGHLLVLVDELKGTGTKLELTLEWSPDTVHFVPANPPDVFTVSEVGGMVTGFTFKAPFFRIRETVSGTRASVTRAVHIQYN